MTRRCSCGAVHRWSDLEPIFDGHDPANVFHGLALANCPRCRSTLAEPAGIAWAAMQVPRVEGVRIESVRP